MSHDKLEKKFFFASNFAAPKLTPQKKYVYLHYTFVVGSSYPIYEPNINLFRPVGSEKNMP